jgi:hypothetical protein
VANVVSPVRMNVYAIGSAVGDNRKERIAFQRRRDQVIAEMSAHTRVVVVPTIPEIAR